MPELPEVESARRVLAEGALGRTIAEVDDHDEWVTRPLGPGALRSALVGRHLTAANRRGKSLWLTTSGRGGDDRDGVDLGLHLGMSGIVVVSAPTVAGGTGDGAHPDGTTAAGHPRIARRLVGGDYRRDRDDLADRGSYQRFGLTFDDGGAMRLLDPRRLSRVRIDPDLDALGPDAWHLDAPSFRAAITAGRRVSTAPIKARLLDQSVLAGVGNLLADETLWRARVDPGRGVDTLSPVEIDRIGRALQDALRDAFDRGGVHTGEVVPFRKAGRHCPRCGAAMVTGTIGGRTTWWCPEEQT